MAPNCEKKKTVFKIFTENSFHEKLDCVTMSFVQNIFLGVHGLKCDVDIISSNFNE